MEGNFAKYDNKTIQLLNTTYDISMAIIFKTVQHQCTTKL